MQHGSCPDKIQFSSLGRCTRIPLLFCSFAVFLDCLWLGGSFSGRIKMSKKGGRGGKAKGGKAPPKPASSSQPLPSVPAPVEEPPKLKSVPYTALPFAPDASNALAADVQKFFGLPLKITLTDGRIIIGDFYSLDNYRNIILANTYQAHITSSTHRTSIFSNFTQNRIFCSSFYSNPNIFLL